MVVPSYGFYRHIQKLLNIPAHRELPSSSVSYKEKKVIF
jgi:hypothetical protein